MEINQNNWQQFIVEIPKIKRAFDVIVCLILTILLLPIVFLIILGIIFESLFIKASRGSILYSEIRISQGKPFKFYKFRIFKSAAISGYLKQYGFVQTKALEQNKNNLTYIGRILKKFYFDEVPQLLCVWKGNMTLVGPRPSNVSVTEEDFRQGRFFRYLIKCGITGPFQIQKDQTSRKEQADVDMEYIEFCRKNPGLKVVLKDIKILFGTVLTVIRAKGV